MSFMLGCEWENTETRTHAFHKWKRRETVMVRLDNVFVIVTRFRGRRQIGSIPDGGRKRFSSPACPDRFLVPANLLFSGYQGLIPLGWSARDVKLTARFCLVSRLTVELYIRHMAVSCTDTTLLLLYERSADISRKPRSHRRNLGARRMACNQFHTEVKVKVKQSQYRLGEALRIPGG
jgi:hypothetical protein